MDAGLRAALAMMLASDPEAVAELEARAQAAFDAGEYAEVAELAGEAFELTGDLRHLYAQAQALRLSGKCSEAAVFYARVLSNTDDAAISEHAQEGLRLCEQELRAHPPDARSAPEPDVAEPPVPTPHATPRPAPPDQPTPWHRDPAGASLLATGLAGVAVGAGLIFQARTDARAAPAADSDVAHARLAGRARGFEIGSAVAFGVGSALIVGAVVRYVVVARARAR